MSFTRLRNDLLAQREMFSIAVEVKKDGTGGRPCLLTLLWTLPNLREDVPEDLPDSTTCLQVLPIPCIFSEVTLSMTQGR